MTHMCRTIGYNVGSGFYQHGVEQILACQIDWVADPIEVMLCGPGYKPSADHRWVADVTHEVAGPGYSRKPLTGRVLVTSTTHVDGPRVVLAADDVEWPPVTLHATCAVVYKGTGDGAGALISYVLFDENPPIEGLPINLRWSADGVGFIARHSVQQAVTDPPTPDSAADACDFD